MVDVRLGVLQARMRRMGLGEEECHSDNYLMSEDASLVVMEFGMNPIVDEERSFDIYPDPPEADSSALPLRPPVVTIMGHVDHGKTTLLDSLRHTSVASGEAGGITQHIGAFSVPLASLVNSESLSEGGVKSITFLDTPGHAAFTGMRARGASVTDIVVLVVAADDGVMPQTKEVLELVKKSGVGLVVAINKCDKPGVDFERVKGALGAEQIHLEEDGGDVPSVKVSGLKGQGLDTLVETLGVLAEVRDLRASVEGRGEGWVLESRVERGRGNSATILVTRGTLHVGSVIIAGTTWCKIRQMLDDKNRPIKSAPPGTPVNITGWKDLPLAGDKILQPYDYSAGKGNKGEDEVKRAVANRIRDKERKALMNDVEVINEKRRIERERQVEEEARHEAIKAEGGDVSAAIRSEERRLKREEEERGKKELRLIIRADVSGTVEAVVGALEGIGNNEVGVKIIHTDVGDVSDSDVAMAEASDATIIGFSVKAPRSIETLASSKNIPLHTESVIYRLIELVRTKVAGLLPPIIETRVNGEATVLQVFTIAVKGQKEGQVVAGCRVGNGVVGKGDVVRVLRGEGREVVFEGPLESLRHLKKEINEARKGSECGMVVDGFKDVKEGDQIVSITKVEKAQQL
ncbi:hypothetical protein HD553DRAFT_329996 [Filobasidium floriforme]|uniref:uncharacterized protein n=1 Tax=Filobasidium floriforme TaxID=5210 RepID=UPI001E8D0A86|nr:uncharacterized protein HD553DRAFT_329996 [Filobasidium floriforme]KAH8079045.1 hypothetical protein HD553DRAFT_329996 [Filobasidium floriforme]